MEIERILIYAGILALMVVYAFYKSWIYRDKDDKGPEMTGHATVKSHRVVQGRYLGKAPSRWNYLMTFALSDGEEIELYVSEATFGTLKPGQSGQLTWQGKRFNYFEPDSPGKGVSP